MASSATGGPGTRLDAWYLTARERGNPASSLTVWSEGNRVVPLIHGATYFDRLVEAVGGLTKGDQMFFTDWRGDPDELMRPTGPTVGELFAGAARRGVVVKGLVWRSHWDKLQYSEAENRHLGEAVEAAGGEVLLDQRVRRGGSHHQKLVVLRHRGRPDLDVAFVGGIDLCHSRRDDIDHRGDPQRQPMSAAYGERPPWHDVQLEISGPAVGALELVFRERWRDHTPIDAHSPVAWLRDLFTHADLSAGELPEQLPDPVVAGPHAVQVLRTYPSRLQSYDFAPQGERSIARGYVKAISRSRRLIYLEDQYMWSKEVAGLFAEALRRNPGLHLVVIVPRHPDIDGRFALPPNFVGRAQAIELCQRAGGDRVHVYDLENQDGVPIYVHSKVCVVDDVWASVGSDNFNRRSWTHDSELSCAVLDTIRDPREPTDPAGLGDGARRFARDLRLGLWREHLDRSAGADDTDLLDPDEAVRAMSAAADALDAWYANGKSGPRPPGRLRHHKALRLSRLTRLWAVPAYHQIYDPDGRPWRLRHRGSW